MTSASTIQPGTNTRSPGDTGMGSDPLYRALRTYTLAIRGLFSARSIGDFRWSADPAQSEIRITTRVPIDVEERQSPAIVISRQSVNTNIVDKRVLSMISNSQQHSSLVSSAMTLNCIASSPAAASQIAWILFQNLPLIRAEIQRWGQIFQISPSLQIGEQSTPSGMVTGGAVQDWVLIPVISQFYVTTEAVATDKEDSGFQSTLRAVTIALETGLGPIPNTSARIEGPAVASGRAQSLNAPTIAGRPVRILQELDSRRVLTQISTERNK